MFNPLLKIVDFILKSLHFRSQPRYFTRKLVDFLLNLNKLLFVECFPRFLVCLLGFKQRLFSLLSFLKRLVVNVRALMK